MFIDAQDEVTRKNGESYLEPHHIKKIVEVLSNYAAIDGFSTIAEINNIADNEYKLSIPLYVDIRQRQTKEYIDIDVALYQWQETNNILMDSLDCLINKINKEPYE